MRALAAVVLLLLPVVAQQPAELLERAQELEQRAEVLLEQGRRGEAFELLAQAAELRAQAKAAARPQKKAKAKPKAKKEKRAGARPELEKGFAALDQAIKKGDMGAAREAAVKVRGLLGRWAKQLEAREKRLAKGPEPERILARIEALERQMNALREELEGRR